MAKVLRQLRDHVKGADTLSANGIATSKVGHQSKAKTDNETPGVKNETLHGDLVSPVTSIVLSTGTDRSRD